jgi:hypothetical protein
MAPYRLIRLRKNTSKGAEILGASTMSYTAACCRLCLPVLGGCTYHIHIRKVVIPTAVDRTLSPLDSCFAHTRLLNTKHAVVLIVSRCISIMTCNGSQHTNTECPAVIKDSIKSQYSLRMHADSNLITGAVVPRSMPSEVGAWSTQPKAAGR